MLRDHGLNMTRSFFYWPDFMPEPDRVDETLVAHYADFLDAHHELGMTSVPTYLVGHMSGENWDPAWRDGRDLYGDVWLVARQAWFIRTMTERFAGHPAVSGWLVSNEMPLYGGPADADTVTAWAQLVMDAVRAGGGTQPASLGDGAWGIEVTGRDNGFSRAPHGGAGRLRRPARLPDGHRPGAPAPAGRADVRARGGRRQARGAGGVRAVLGLRVAGERRALLPPAAAHLAAGRRDRLGGLEQHRLRRPAAPGPLPPPPLRDALRHHRPARRPEAAAARAAGLRPGARPGRAVAVRAGHHTHGAGGVVLPRGRAPDDRRARTRRSCSTPSSRGTSPRGRPTWRPGSCGSGTGSTTATRSTWCRRSRR